MWTKKDNVSIMAVISAVFLECTKESEMILGGDGRNKHDINSSMR